MARPTRSGSTPRGARRSTRPTATSPSTTPGASPASRWRSAPRPRLRRRRWPRGRRRRTPSATCRPEAAYGPPLMNRFVIGVVLAALALAVIGCSKEKERPVSGALEPVLAPLDAKVRELDQKLAELRQKTE